MADVESAVRLGEWLTIAATVIGPVLAVQAQKWVERDRAKEAMKDGIFRTLMATRGSRLAVAHVEALNMIPIAFYGRRFFFGQFRWQRKAERRVTNAWREYYANLSIDSSNHTPDQHNLLASQRDEKFIFLLQMIAIARSFDFEPVDLRQGYSPNSHEWLESDIHSIRSGMARILRGQDAFAMKIVDWPSQQPSQPAPAQTQTGP